MTKPAETGKNGENIAAAHLERAGCRILERNYRCLFGEIDLVAREGDTLVFAEVKSRTSGAFGPPETAVGCAKQRKMSKVALHYIETYRLHDAPARFDVIAVRFHPGGSRVEWIRNAFDCAFGA